MVVKVPFAFWVYPKFFWMYILFYLIDIFIPLKQILLLTIRLANSFEITSLNTFDSYISELYLFHNFNSI